MLSLCVLTVRLTDPITPQGDYKVVGNQFARCMGSQFNATLGQCVNTQVTCSVPVRDHGVTSVEGFVAVDNFVFLTCDKDYLLNGTGAVQCLKNGTLDNTLGSCISGKASHQDDF